MTGLCQCGCGELTKIATRNDPRSKEVKGKHRTYIRGHARRGKFGPYGRQKGKIRYEVDPETGCWNWLLCVAGKYGSTHIDLVQVGAHVEAYVSAKGPIPDGYEVDHLCRNTLCVNPDHLEAVTRAENIRRRSDVILDVDKVREIRLRFEKEAISKAQLAREYGVARTTVSSVIFRTNWVDVA